MTRNNPEIYELPCSECHTLTCVELLRDASELAPFAGLVCPDCEDNLTVSAHDDESCGCTACKKDRARNAHYTPAGAGGFSPGTLRLVFSREEDPANDPEF